MSKRVDAMRMVLFSGMSGGGLSRERECQYKCYMSRAIKSADPHTHVRATKPPSNVTKLKRIKDKTQHFLRFLKHLMLLKTVNRNPNL